MSKQRIKYFVKKIRDNIFIFFAKITKTNLIIVGYNQIGILNYEEANQEEQEIRVIKNILTKINTENLIIFDIGANTGKYSSFLSKEFEKAKIYSFEPNINSYKKAQELTSGKNIKLHNIGFSSETGNGSLYDYRNNIGSEHASTYKEVFTYVHRATNITEEKFSKDTIENFCKNNNIERINFIKIDTEGSEFEILKGAEKMISGNNIDVIQFEFNQMNIISRVFLKDFYELLTDYNIYRICGKKLMPALEYKTINEIFQYQNFLAVSKTINSNYAK